MKWSIRIRGPFFIALVVAVVILFMLVLFFLNSTHTSTLMEAEAGTIVYSPSTFHQNSILGGEWRFYKDQLLLPDSIEQVPEFVTLPHTWIGEGVGTYQLTLSGLEPDACYSLYVQDNGAAYTLFINSKQMAQSGTPASSKTEEIVHLESQIVKFMTESETVTITLQISNFHTYSGGIMRLPKFGTPYNITVEHNLRLITQMILLGGTLVIGLYNFSLFILNTKERSALYFAGFCFAVSLRIMITGERMINYVLPSVNWQLLYLLQFAVGAVMLATFILFMYCLFKDSLHEGFIKIVLLLSGILLVAPFILPIKTLFYLDQFFLALSLTFFIYLVISLIRAIKANVQGSVFSFAGIMFLLGSVFMDAFLPPGTNVIPISIFVFLIFQALVIAEKYSFILEQNKMLSHVIKRDSMTNLYKKEHFYKLIESIIEESSSDFAKHSMMFIDIDNFKYVNDCYGHDIGDEVIVTIAEKILRSLRYSDIASRFGGDEFVVWLNHTTSDEATLIADRIIDHIKEPMIIDEHTVQISASIGISYYASDGLSLDTLLNVCDQRMYRAKSLGKNQYCQMDDDEVLKKRL